MKVVFFSNFLTHHQLPFCMEMCKCIGNEFCFVATEPIAQEQRSLGYQDLNKQPFVIRAYENEKQNAEAIKLSNKADVVIIGSAPMRFIASRLQQKKLVFLYSERLYKSGYQAWKWLLRLWRHWRQYGRHKNCYLLCASAYTAGDFARTYTFINKAYKWGYFPEVRRYADIETLIEEKEVASVLWAGRFIDWKHPEHVIEVSRRLKEDGYKFHINMLGNGEQLELIRQQIVNHHLGEQITLCGSMSPEQVRSYMEQSQVYLFTSDRNEGWGAVLNESMNSGCAVVASDSVGAVPFLLNDGENGLVFRSGDVDDLYQKVKFLLDNPDECGKLGKNAYLTMTELWNAETAAERLLNLSEKLLQGEKHPYPFDDGPCSKAEIIKD